LNNFVIENRLKFRFNFINEIGVFFWYFWKALNERDLMEQSLFRTKKENQKKKHGNNGLGKSLK